MKLRNRKTGEIIDLDEWTIYTDTDAFSVENDCDETAKRYRYRTLDALNEEWEDYKPKEPLIKDEKIRKAVRAWAKACNLSHATYKLASNEFYDADTRGAFAIKFKLIPVEVYLEDGESYTIAELCGEDVE